MARKSAFNKYVDRYESWFENNHWIYIAELKAVGMLLPDHGRGLEIGVGTGRFAAPLSIDIGLDPSVNMATVAKQRAAVLQIGGKAACRLIALLGILFEQLQDDGADHIGDLRGHLSGCNRYAGHAVVD